MMECGVERVGLGIDGQIVGEDAPRVIGDLVHHDESEHPLRDVVGRDRVRGIAPHDRLEPGLGEPGPPQIRVEAGAVLRDDRPSRQGLHGPEFRIRGPRIEGRSPDRVA